MKKTAILVLLFAVASMVPWLFSNSAGAAPIVGPAPRPGPGYRVSGPYTNRNLSVFLIHGRDTIKSTNILTLEEAMAQKKVVVHETGNVNMLTVENKSDAIVFIQSGDIVKGGRQDRTMQYDLLIPPKSGLMQVPTFCVEHGRWSQRGSESSADFSGAANNVIGKPLKIAAKNAGDQVAVWAQVAEQQAKLKAAIPGIVAMPAAAPTSLNATIDQREVAQASTDHIQRLAGIVTGKNDVVGYAFAINGKVNSADMYASNALFVKLWPKLLKSSAIEAVSEQQQGKTFGTPSQKEIMQLISSDEKSPGRTKIANKDMSMTEEERSDAYTYRTRWYSAPKEIRVGDDATVLHTNYLTK